MQKIKEIGLIKIVKFFLFTIFEAIYSLCLFPPIRTLLLNLFGAKISYSSILMKVKLFNLHMKGPSALKIGDDCFIGDETLLDLYDDIELESKVTIAQRVTIITHTNVGFKNHPLQEFFPKASSKVTLKQGSVVGACSTILPGVTVGKESFIAAGSVVTKDVPARSLFGGVPAKLIKKIK